MNCGAYLRCDHFEKFKLVGQMVLLNWDIDGEGGENAFNIEIKRRCPLVGMSESLLFSLQVV